jgi:hypothetical protein
MRKKLCASIARDPWQITCEISCGSWARRWQLISFSFLLVADADGWKILLVMHGNVSDILQHFPAMLVERKTRRLLVDEIVEIIIWLHNDIGVVLRWNSVLMMMVIIITVDVVCSVKVFQILYAQQQRVNALQEEKEEDWVLPHNARTHKRALT